MNISVIGQDLTLRFLATKMKWEMYGAGLCLFSRKRKHTVSSIGATVFLGPEF